MNKIVKLVSVIIPVCTLSACATMMSGQTQSVKVQAVDAETHQPITNVACNVHDSKGGSYPVVGNPGMTEVTRNSGALSVKCNKKGYSQTQVGAGSSFNAWTLANVVFWPGIIVDAASGAATKYPSHITVVMDKNGNTNTA